MVEKHWAKGSDRSWGRTGCQRPIAKNHCKNMDIISCLSWALLPHGANIHSYTKVWCLQWKWFYELWFAKIPGHAHKGGAGSESPRLVLISDRDLFLCWWWITFIVSLPATCWYNVTERNGKTPVPVGLWSNLFYHQECVLQFSKSVGNLLV